LRAALGARTVGSVNASSDSGWVRAADEGVVAELPRPARIAAAAALVLGSGCQVIAFLVSPTPADTTEWLSWIAENPGRGQFSKMFDVLAMPFLVASAAVYIALGRRRSPRLAWISGVALGAGLVGLATLQGWEVLAYNLVVDDALSPEAVAQAVDDAPSSPAGLAVGLLFLLVGFLGLLGTLLALWRSHAVPRLAVLLLFIGFLVDVFGRPVEAHVLSFVGATWIAVNLLTVQHRRPARSNAPRAMLSGT
jgi:hypothetical protein